MIKDDLAPGRSTPRPVRPLAVAIGALLLGAPAAAMAQTNAGLLLEQFPTEKAVDADAEAIFLESGHAQETDEAFQLRVYNARGKFRVVPGERASPRIGYDFTFLDLDTDVPGLPERLSDQSLAAAFPVGKYEDWIFGASVGLGYAGDGGFDDGDAWYGLASFVAFRQLGEDRGLALALDYDGNRTFLPDVPLPAIAYLFKVNQRLNMTLGVPVSSIEWTPSDQFRLQLTFNLPDDVRLDVGYEVLPDLTLFGNVRQQRDAFYADGLPENYDRILFQQRRAEAGVRYDFGDVFGRGGAEPSHASIDLALGYAWGGEFSEGFDFRESDEIADVSDEPYVRAGVELRF
jgi:hypothetical protein